MKKTIYIALSLIFLLSACEGKKSTDIRNEYVSIQDGRFVTPEKQELYLKAINVVNKNKDDTFIPRYKSDVYQNIKENGLNSIRLGVNWSALEPEPLQYSEAYLTQLDNQIQLIREQGLYIILDMHQDLFSIKYGNGAPVWATLDDGKIHTTGEVWSDAYYISDAVKTSFDNFWDNKKIESTGLGVQEHYARLWQLLAKRYANETSIVGYDIMNEPFGGSVGSQAMQSMFAKVEEMDSSFTAEKIKELLFSPDGKTVLLEKLADINVYRQVIQASEKVYNEFERTKLQKFYQHITDSIRTVDANHILFLEPSVSANNGVLSVIEPTKLANGEYDKQVAFAPHLYDIVLDTDLAFSASGERLDFILDQIKKSASKFNLPIFVGEWGAFYNNDKCSPVAKHYTQMFEQSIVSNAYWDYTSDLWSLAHFHVMQTIYPQKISGRLVSATSVGNKYIIKWKGNNSKEKSIIYVPNTEKIKSIDINIEGTAKKETFDNNTSNGYITIDVGAMENEVIVTVELKE